MRLDTTLVSMFMGALLTITGCSSAGTGVPSPSASPNPSLPAASPVQTVPRQGPTAQPPESIRPQTVGYNPSYCGVTSHAKDGRPSSALLTIDDFPYQDGNVMIEVAEWAKQSGTMMESFPIAKEVNAYNRKHNTDLVAKVRELGTYVSNHTYSHANLTEVSNKQAAKQIGSGIKSTYVRPPYGAYNSQVRKLIESDYKARVCHWTIDTEDWQRKNGAYVSAETLVARVHKQLKNVKPGEPVVILGHYQTNYPKALAGIRNELVKAKLTVCAPPAAATSSDVPYPIC